LLNWPGFDDPDVPNHQRADWDWVDLGKSKQVEFAHQARNLSSPQAINRYPLHKHLPNPQIPYISLSKILCVPGSLANNRVFRRRQDRIGTICENV